MAAEQYEEKERFDGKKVKILMPTYAEGTPQDRYQWRKNIAEVNVGEEANPIKKYLIQLNATSIPMIGLVAKGVRILPETTGQFIQFESLINRLGSNYTCLRKVANG